MSEAIPRKTIPRTCSVSYLNTRLNCSITLISIPYFVCGNERNYIPPGKEFIDLRVSHFVMYIFHIFPSIFWDVLRWLWAPLIIFFNTLWTITPWHANYNFRSEIVALIFFPSWNHLWLNLRAVFKRLFCYFLTSSVKENMTIN